MNAEKKILEKLIHCKSETDFFQQQQRRAAWKGFSANWNIKMANSSSNGIKKQKRKNKGAKVI